MAEGIHYQIIHCPLNNFVFQHAFYCHVCHCSLCAISYQQTIPDGK